MSIKHAASQQHYFYDKSLSFFYQPTFNFATPEISRKNEQKNNIDPAIESNMNIILQLKYPKNSN